MPVQGVYTFVLSCNCDSIQNFVLLLICFTLVLRSMAVLRQRESYKRDGEDWINLENSNLIFNLLHYDIV